MKPRVISLYSGAGGLDYGFEAAGFRTSVAIELDRDCCETLRSNRKWSVIERSIFDVPTEEMLEMASAEPGEIDVVIGGPPCQPFSKAGYWARGDALRLDDPRAATLSAYLRVVEEALPRVFLLENVGGLAFSGKDDGLQMLLRGIELINKKTKSAYRPAVALLNAVDYGVPQMRERLFIVAARDGRQFHFPAPTHFPEPAKDELTFDARNATRHRTAWDALADVMPASSEDRAPRGKWAGLLPSSPEGYNYLWHTDRGGGRPIFGWRRRYWSFLLKLAKAKPSWTIQAQPGPAIGPFHWDNRYLSMRELCRLQTFPDDVNVLGTRASVQKQLGNAVPSLLGEVIAREIRTQLLGYRSLLTAPKLMPEQRESTPSPKKIGRVPAQYRVLEGRHSAHPGTGKGTRAKARQLESAAS